MTEIFKPPGSPSEDSFNRCGNMEPYCGYWDYRRDDPLDFLASDATDKLRRTARETAFRQWLDRIEKDNEHANQLPLDRTQKRT